MEILSDPTPDMLAMPRFDDGAIDTQELLRRLAEQVVNAVMDAEADQLCGGGSNSRNGYRERSLATYVGTLTLRIPKLRTGSFFPDDVIERYQRADRALVAAVAEMHSTGTSTRKVQRVAEKMGVSRLSKDQVSAIASSLDADVEELCARPLEGSPVPYVWLDATYVKCRRGGRVASTAVVTAIGCDAGGWRRVLGGGVVDTESYDSWLAFLRKIRDRGVSGVQLVVSDAHGGLVAAASEVFQGAAWQRCAVHLMRDCMREAGSWQLRRRVGRIVSQVFRGRDTATVTAMYHVACDMLERVLPEGGDDTRECRAGRPGIPRLPAVALEAPAHQQRAGEDQPRDKAQVARRAGVPFNGLAGAARGRGHETWQESRYFSEERMNELYDEGHTRGLDGTVDWSRLEAEARKMIESGLELADRIEAA